MSDADTIPAPGGPVEALQRSLERGRLAHAYLFAGGTAGPLEAAARRLARTVNCSRPRRRAPNGLSVESCGACPACRRIDDDLHPDVRWVRPESKLRVVKVEQMRELMAALQLKATEAPHKIGIIAGADRMHEGAANAFLKTLEEPPASSVLLLLSTEPERLLETVQSRCLRFTFSGPAGLPESERAWLRLLSGAAARPASGLLPRYRLLDVLLQRLGEARKAAEAELTARSPLERHEEVEGDLRERWTDELSAAVEADYRRRRSDMLGAVQWWLRDVWLAALGLPAHLLAAPECAEDTRAVARRISARDAGENVAVIERTQALLHTNVQEALALGGALLKLRL